MARKFHITAETLRKLIDYDHNTGVFTWRKRTPEMFDDGYRSKEFLCHWWNIRYSGKVAGSETNSGYTVIMLNSQYCLAHRVAWIHYYGEDPHDFLDHINGIRTDNRICNLRVATRSQNSMNKKTQCNSKSGFKGVTFDNSSGRWRARIMKNNRMKHIGRFKTIEEAAAAYARAAEKLHGEFARVA